MANNNEKSIEKFKTVQSKTKNNSLKRGLETKIGQLAKNKIIEK